MAYIVVHLAGKGRNTRYRLQVAPKRGTKSGQRSSKTKLARVYHRPGIVHPFASHRALNRRYRRAQGGPGLDARNNPRGYFVEGESS